MELISKKNHTKPFDWFVDIERIFHITIDQAGRINESHQAKFLLLRSRDLGIEVIHHTCKDVLKRRKKNITSTTQIIHYQEHVKQNRTKRRFGSWFGKPFTGQLACLTTYQQGAPGRTDPTQGKYNKAGITDKFKKWAITSLIFKWNVKLA